MSSNCREFQRLLVRELSPDTPSELTTLSWHEHLLSCESCRELLRAEEALEVLLETLPQPKLPPHLARRVLARLRAIGERDRGLDQLLELDELAAPAGLSGKILAGLQLERGLQREPLDLLLEKDTRVDVPAGLAERVLAGLESERFVVQDEKLDRLLELDTVQTPVGLATRTIRALEAERGLKKTGVILFFERRAVKFGAAAAAGILVFAAAWSGFSGDPKEPRRNEVALADRELLEDYFVLDNYELLMSDDVDVLLASSIDSTDEIALDLERRTR